MNMDKIPLDEIKTKKNGKMTLFGIDIRKSEYANSEKINQLIEWNRELQTRLENIEHA